MPDITTDLLPKIRQHRLPGLDLGETFVYPNYDGLSILNIPGSICRMLGAPEIGTMALDPAVTALLGETFRRVILILVDALSLERLRRWMQDGTAPVWQEMSERGLLTPLTSITPSTTSAALTSLWSGRSAAEHGIVGYELWLKEYGVVANMITHAPINFRGDVASLQKAGFDPETYLPFPTMGSHLKGYGVKTYALQHSSILRSGLSQMFFKDVEAHAFSTPTDLWVNLRHLVESTRYERQFIWVYWGEVDHFSHFYAPDDERTISEFSAFSRAFAESFLRRLSAAAGRDTLVLLTADHGQITTPKNAHYEMRNHPELARHLHIMPTGENRLIYFFTRPGETGAVREYMERTWPGQFAFLDPATAVQNGLFGPGEPHPRLSERLGDLIATGREAAYIWWADKENPLIGRHGGLSPDEMLVPLLGARL
ncbi:MAG: alkaline phosphatase family protein [Anaerolineales bacterium]|nr:alkaline phosphatase family protein [Anaerolineales bacterium]